MSEPVGNAPRGTNIPSNSHNTRDTPQQAKGAPASPQAEKPETVKIVTGKVITRKPSWYKRLGRSMMADDASNIGSLIVDEVIIPGTKQMLYTIVVGMASRTLFGVAKGPLGQSLVSGGMGMGAGVGQSRVSMNYQAMSEGRAPMGLSQAARANHAFNEIILETQQEAIYVVSQLVERVITYGAATVADLYGYVGTTGSFMDRGWGWTDLSTADVKQVPGGWLIDLPKPAPLR